MSRDPAGAQAMPEPGETARAHSAALSERIRAEIAANGGAIPFRRYMEMALYEPGLGYYAAAGGARLGETADFVTAPEVSPLFGRSLARQCAAVLAEVGGDVFEPGAGSGALAAELLAELAALGRAPERYRILEPSAELRQLQQQRIAAHVPHLVDRCVWHAEWPQTFDGIVVANEVLDAMPVEGFRIGDDGTVERRQTIATASGGFDDAWYPADTALTKAVRHIEADIGQRLPADYRSELNPHLGGWFDGLAASLSRGGVVVVDYGYVRSEHYLPERCMGTLVCSRAHRAHDDPYDLPGLTDITAFVDFTAVTEAATGAGLALEGFSPQAHFLFGCGLDTVASAIMDEADARSRVQISQQIKQLTLPGEMGERFNAIGFSRGLTRPLEGCSINDLSRRL
jgi:SAM-dependent MidA family methyltransferase